MRPSQPPACADCPISREGLCARLGAAGRQALAARAAVVRHAAGETLWDGAGPPDFVGIVQSGHVRLQRYGLQGRRQIISLFNRGDLLGGLGRMPQDFTIEAATPVQFCRFARRSFLRLVETDARLQTAVYAQHLDQLAELRWLTWTLGGLSAEERVVSFLAMATSIMPFARHGARGGLLTLELPRPDIADLLGTSVESISRISKRLEGRGLIEILDPKRFLIPDLGALVRTSGLDATFLRLPPSLLPVRLQQVVAGIDPALPPRDPRSVGAPDALRQ